MTTIYSEELTDAQSVNYTGRVFGLHFPFRLEPAICGFARELSRDYTGGQWRFFGLSNGGFYMAPRSEARFRVIAENGFEGEMTGDAFGLTACLYALSHLSFGGTGSFTKSCAEHFHLLREYALDHVYAAAIFAAAD